MRKKKEDYCSAEKGKKVSRTSPAKKLSFVLEVEERGKKICAIINCPGKEL